MAAHIALHETGAPFEARPLSFATKDTRKPEFLAINPNGKVPTLLIDGRVLTEVAGILFYLARAFPQADLLPVDDAEAEAQVVSWMSFIASAIHPARQAGLERVREVWQIADTRLGRNEWAVGGGYSIADIHLFRLYWRVRERARAQARRLRQHRGPLRAHDGAAGGQEDDRDRGEDRLLAAALNDAVIPSAARDLQAAVKIPRCARDDSGYRVGARCVARPSAAACRRRGGLRGGGASRPPRPAERRPRSAPSASRRRCRPAHDRCPSAIRAGHGRHGRGAGG